jgi:hypothetical protein
MASSAAASEEGDLRMAVPCPALAPARRRRLHVEFFASLVVVLSRPAPIILGVHQIRESFLMSVLIAVGLVGK